jgi:hypothetical protein
MKTRRPLFEIAHDILRALDQSEGEIDAAMQALDLELEDKVSAYKVVIQRLEADADANETIGKDLRAHYAAKADVARKQVERVKQHLAKGLEVAGVEDVRTSTAHVFYKTTKAVELEDQAAFIEAWRFGPALPSFITMAETYRLDKRVLAESLEAGTTWDGAKLVERKHLQVR